MPTVLLVRHGQASFGGDDYDVLSARGRAQAARLADALARRGAGYERVVSGSLARQRNTAAALGEYAVDSRWDEYDADDILAHHSPSAVRLERRGPVSLSPREFQDVLEAALFEWVAAGEASPARETWPAFAARVAAALDAAAERRTVVSTSGGVIAAVGVALLGVASEAFVALNRVTVNAGVSKVVRGRSGTSLVSFNEHAHLEPGGLVTYR